VARYCASFSGLAGTNTANTALVNLVGGTANRLFVREVYVVNTAAITTAPLLALGKSTARGTQTTTATSITQDEQSVAALGLLDTAWSVAPTFTNTAANRARVRVMTTTVGQEAHWQFWDNPFTIPATSGAGLILWNVNASGNPNNGSFAGHIVWDEDQRA